MASAMVFARGVDHVLPATVVDDHRTRERLDWRSGRHGCVVVKLRVSCIAPLRMSPGEDDTKRPKGARMLVKPVGGRL